jgi:cyclopropane-fatty-acyl-phospholipid synthase
MSTLAAGSKGRLIVESVANIGPHYARTLREWRRRFVQRFETVVVPSLQKEYAVRTGGDKDGKPRKLGRDDIEVFRRKWLCEYRLSLGYACQGGSSAPRPTFNCEGLYNI